MDVMNLFKQAASYTQKPKTVEITQGTYLTDPATGEAEFFPTEKEPSFTVDIVPLTATQALEIDRVMDAVHPPVIIKKTPQQGGGIIDQIEGYNYECPIFKAQRGALLPMRDAITALHGCPKLREDTPGETIDEKAKAILDQTPESLITGIAMMVRDYSFGINAKGADVFTDGDSPASPSSSDSPEESPASETTKSSPKSPE